MTTALRDRLCHAFIGCMAIAAAYVAASQPLFGWTQ
jgi:hypothetical protein